MVSRNCDRHTPLFHYQLKMKKRDNINNFWPITLKFGMQVPFTRLHATVKFGIDPTIFSQTNPTYQKVKFGKIWRNLAGDGRGPNMVMSYTIRKLMKRRF